MDDMQLDAELGHLFEFLKARQCIVALDDVSSQYLDIHSPEVLEMIVSGSGAWKKLVPDCVANAIVERNLFGYAG